MRSDSWRSCFQRVLKSGVSIEEAAPTGGDASNSSGTFTEGRDVWTNSTALEKPTKTYELCGFREPLNPEVPELNDETKHLFLQ